MVSFKEKHFLEFTNFISIQSVEWKLAELNEDGKIKCHDCNQTYTTIKSAKKHFKDVHMEENKYICKVCDKVFRACFGVEDYMKLHLKAHMLPKMEG